MSATVSPVPRRGVQLGAMRLQDVRAYLVARPRLSWLVGLLVALLLTAPAWTPWLDPRQYLWGVDDAKNHMIRIYHLTWLIERGVWYPRWLPDMYMGYGYPVLNFYAPIFYYLAWGLGQLLRLSVWDSFRAVGVVAALVSAGGVYALTVALWRRLALGVLAAVVLLYGPYVVQINIFKRGDLPEALALALVPWLLLALLRLWLAQTWEARLGWTVGSTLLGSAVVLSHNLTALVAAVVAAVGVAYLLAVRPAWQPLGLTLLAGAVAVGLTAFFWLPAIADGRLVQLEELWKSGGLDFRGWFIEPNGGSPRQQSEFNRQTKVGLLDLNLHYPHQLVAPPKISWAQALLGALALGATVAGIGTLARHWRQRRARSRPGEPERASLPLAGLPFLVLGLLSWYLTFAQSAPVWDAVPGLPLLQFPWRLLGVLGFCVAVAGAGALAGAMTWIERRWPEQGQLLATGLVVLVGAVTLVNHLGDREFVLKPEPDRVVSGRTVFADEYK
ncbi:MAG TPA: 6-pyruvoyl-tetrahydropterin synthase-related protein, partial [Chloroflexota bacterium]|nr:6-pyruvoyl-tetrahydropterin synthase-related protein [Chloroflexota bacterium]